ncbi:hypothetical protein ACWF94_33895, partial [Streptomyces sp. NPDC055078]
PSALEGPMPHRDGIGRPQEDSVDLVLLVAAAIVVVSAVGSAVRGARRVVERMVADIVVRTLGGRERRPDRVAARPAGAVPRLGAFPGAGVSRRGGRDER